MTQKKAPAARVVTARRISAIGGLAALAATGTLAPEEAQAESADTTAGHQIAQADGEGEAGSVGEGEGEASAGGEGEGEGEGEGGGTTDPDTAFLSGLSFMEGHIRAGMTLYETGDVEAAVTHVGHPIEEKYDAIADRLNALGLGGLRGDIEALASAAESGADYVRLQALFETVRETHEEARANFTLAQQVAGLVALTRTAGAEYAVAVKGGALSNLHEYQDSWGFLRVVETEARQMAESDDPAIAGVGVALLEQVAATEAAFGDIQGEGDFEMDPSILYGAAARMELAGLELDAAGEGEGSFTGEGEGEGESSSGSEGEGEAASGGEGEGQ